jgi:hypothetical protein
VYPIIFTYRQFIELELKYLIATYGFTVGIEANWRSHDVAFLWSEFVKVLAGYVMEGVGGFFTGCDGYLDHLQGAGP